MTPTNLQPWSLVLILEDCYVPAHARYIVQFAAWLDERVARQTFEWASEDAVSELLSEGKQN